MVISSPSVMVSLSLLWTKWDDGSITLLVALVILIAFSAFFSASETAFSSLNQIRLKSRAEEGDTSAARVLAMAEKYDKLLSSILIGNNIVNIAAASIGTVLFTKWLGEERGATASTIVLTIVVLIFGEVTPKTLAKEMPEKRRRRTRKTRSGSQAPPRALYCHRP